MKPKFASLIAAGLIAATGSALAADFSDTWLGYRRSNSYTEPGIAVDVPKNTYTLGHFSGYKYGTNFFSVDILQSLANDPAHRNSTSQRRNSTLSIAVRCHRQKSWAPNTSSGRSRTSC